MDESTESTLNFYGNNPGAARFGNFINYYTFHGVEERVSKLNPKMFPNVNNSSLLILDVGCNTGELTIEIYKYLQSVIYPNKTINVLAVDLDPVLIERASKEQNNISFISCNVMNEYGMKIITEYLNKFDRKSFDITFCFSVTMWLHINNGDDKFIEFLNFITHHSKSIIIEPQPWKCYKNALRRLKRAGADFEQFNSLHIKENIEHVIENKICETHVKVYESPSSSWNRIIQSYHLKNDNFSKDM